MEETIVIDGNSFALLKEQRSGLAVYKNADAYLRLGPAARIARNLEAHEAMERAGYPVPPLLGRGSYHDYLYFIEGSLGDKTFRTLFEEDILARDAISDEHFQEFMQVSQQYLEAQVKTLVPADPAAFSIGVHLDIIREELPQYRSSLPDKFERVLKKIAAFPYVLSHGDFNAANMYPRGVIDLEDAFPAPFGFDAVSAISTIEWFPTSSEFEFFAHYRYSAEQKTAYLTMCDTVSQSAGCSPISACYDDFAFCRAMWSVVNMQAWPKLRTWRYERFLKMYLRS